MASQFLKEIQANDTLRRRLAKKMAHDCFRNSKLEHFHAYPEERLNDAEMKELMIDVVNNTYDFLCLLFGPRGEQVVKYLSMRDSLSKWNDPDVKDPGMGLYRF